MEHTICEARADADVSASPRVLVIDDSQATGRMVQKVLEMSLALPVDYADSYAACESLLKRRPGAYRVAVVDLHLPDAPDGETVDLVLRHGVAAIVLTGSLDESLRDRIMSRPIVDYVIKEQPGSIDTVERDVRRILRNAERKVLVAEDSRSYNDYLAALLRTQCCQVIQATDGLDALALLDENPEVALVVADYLMPGLDGIELTSVLRGQRAAHVLGVIGVTSSEDPFVGVKFLKAGANDIVRKPFLPEEFLIRVNTCLDHLDSVRTIQEQANRDFLTKLYNRRYLFEAGGALFQSARRGQIRLAAAMVDIDFFKRINDTHGHDVGDLALKTVAKTLTETFRGTDIVARMGGEEFCILAADPDCPFAVIDRLRQKIEALEIPLQGGRTLRLTACAGVTAEVAVSLSDMLKAADDALYEAKQSGRNRVVLR